MQNKLSRKFLAMFFTLFTLIVFNLFSTVLFPWVGFTSFKFLFHIILILFFSFHVKDDYLPIYILMIELTHSLFTIQGWEIGTLSGIILSVLIYSFKDLIHLSNTISSILYSFVFFIFWYIIFGLIYYSKIHNFDFFWNNITIFFIESIIASILCPFIFTLLLFIWGEKKNNSFTV